MLSSPSLVSVAVFSSRSLLRLFSDNRIVVKQWFTFLTRTVELCTALVQKVAIVDVKTMVDLKRTMEISDTTLKLSSQLSSNQLIK